MRTCLTCGKPTVWENNPWRPFCSERCKLIDFDRWASEEYRVPGQSINPADIQGPKPAPDADDDRATED